MKTLRSTGRMDSPTKELLNRARKIWSGIISEGEKMKLDKYLSKNKNWLRTFYFCPGENDVLEQRLNLSIHLASN